MINLFGEEYDQIAIKQIKRDKAREKWNRGFQKWSDKMVQIEAIPDGKCGCGYICDYCDDNSKGRPCVRAVNNMLIAQQRHLNYESLSYEEVFFNGGKKGGPG